MFKTYGDIILETVAAQIKKCERIGNTLIKRQRVRHLINALRSEAAMGESQLAETLGYLGYGASQVDGAWWNEERIQYEKYAIKMITMIVNNDNDKLSELKFLFSIHFCQWVEIFLYT